MCLGNCPDLIPESNIVNSKVMKLMTETSQMQMPQADAQYLLKHMLNYTLKGIEDLHKGDLSPDGDWVGFHVNHVRRRLLKDISHPRKQHYGSILVVYLC